LLRRHLIPPHAPALLPGQNPAEPRDLGHGLGHGAIQQRILVTEIVQPPATDLFE
jgi:hypothetical protein